MTRLLFILALVLPSFAFADPVEIVSVKTKRDGMGWQFSVTVRHPDTGWDHYADAWEVLTLDGKRIAIRELAHPHVNEQPFTRSLNNVVLPDGTREVLVRGRCSVDGWSKEAVKITLDR